MRQELIDLIAEMRYAALSAIHDEDVDTISISEVSRWADRLSELVIDEYEEYEGLL